MSQGFPKQARLLNGTEYTQVLRRAEKNSGWARKLKPKNSLDRARLGLVVPKRGTAKAHDRNQVKRIIREQFRLSRRQLPSLDIVVQVFGKISKQQLAQALRRQFDKLSGLSDSGPNN